MNVLDTFRTPPYMHNCAQAIAYKWSHLYKEGDKIVVLYQQIKGGTAPGGLCGALYAAMQALPSEAEAIKQAFVREIGYPTCREIKSLSKVPCPRCVEVADLLLQKFASH